MCAWVFGSDLEWNGSRFGFGVCWCGCCCCCSDLCVDGDPNGNLVWSMRWIWRKLNKAQILVHPLSFLAQRTQTHTHTLTDHSQYCFSCFIDILSCAFNSYYFPKCLCVCLVQSASTEINCCHIFSYFLSNADIFNNTLTHSLIRSTQIHGEVTTRMSSNQ